MKVADVPASKEGRRSRQCDPDLGSQRQVHTSFDEPTIRSMLLNSARVNPQREIGVGGRNRITDMGFLRKPDSGNYSLTFTMSD